MLKQVIAVATVFLLSSLPSIAADPPKKKPAPARAVAKDRLQCKVGPLEKQTRLVMETVKGKPVYLAYWSSNGPFHCSFESWPAMAGRGGSTRAAVWSSASSAARC